MSLATCVTRVWERTLIRSKKHYKCTCVTRVWERTLILSKKHYKCTCVTRAWEKTLILSKKHYKCFVCSKSLLRVKCQIEPQNISDQEEEAVVAMVAFEDAKGTDPTDVHQKLYQLKTRYEFNKSDLKFWFNQFESCLQDCGVKTSGQREGSWPTNCHRMQ